MTCQQTTSVMFALLPHGCDLHHATSSDLHHATSSRRPITSVMFALPPHGCDLRRAVKEIGGQPVSPLRQNTRAALALRSGARAQKHAWRSIRDRRMGHHSHLIHHSPQETLPRDRARILPQAVRPNAYGLVRPLLVDASSIRYHLHFYLSFLYHYHFYQHLINQ